MNARDRRFLRFVEDHWCTVFGFTEAVIREFGLPPDIEKIIAEKGIPADWLEQVKKDFEAAEFQRKVALSRKRRQAGRKGGKTAGRGRPKKKSP
jgi:hypothetical protein